MLYREPDVDLVPAPTPQTRPGSPEMIGMDYNLGPFEAQTSPHEINELKTDRRENEWLVRACAPCQKFSKAMYGAGAWYSATVPARCPCLCASIGLVLAGAISALGIAAIPPEIETDFDSFTRTDANVSITRDAFLNALQAREESMMNGRRLQSSMYRAFNIYVAFELKEGMGRSILDPAVLKKIRRIEKAMLDMPEWQQLCSSTGEEFRHLCDPGLSVTSHAFPSVSLDSDISIVPSQLSFDGGGQDALMEVAMIDLIHRQGLSSIVFPLDFDSQAPEKTREIRSAFHFKVHCCSSAESLTDRNRKSKQLTKQWEEFVEQAALPHLQQIDREDPDWPVRVYFDGTKFESIEVLDELWGDVHLAAASMGFVLLYVILHTGSIFLGVAGLITVFLSVPLSYIIFQLCAGTTKLTIASFLSLFLVIGLGSDVIFVITDVWKDSAQSKERFEARLRFTTFYAGKASLATTITTASSFFANLISVLRPVREFGMFMGLCVMLVWVLAMLIYAPLCIVDEYWCKRCSLHRCIRVPHPTVGNGQPVSARASYLGMWADRLHPCRWLCVFVLPLLAMLAGVLSSFVAEVDTEIPQIFPAEHNRNQGIKVLDRFEPIDSLLSVNYWGPATIAKVCKVDDYDDQLCDLRWCEVIDTKDFSLPAEESCSCSRKPSSACGDAERALVRQRYIGLETVEISGVFSEQILRGQGGTLSIASWSADMALPMILQDWSRGNSMFQPVTDAFSLVVRENRSADTSCGWEEICFCGTYHCTLSSEWEEQPDFLLRRLRLLQVTTLVPANMRVVVDVVFGIKVDGHSPLLGELDSEDQWSFDAEFDLSRPWAQRNLYAFCTELPDELRVVQRVCWIEEFRNWIVHTRQERYPVPHRVLQARVQEYIASGGSGGVRTKDSVWRRDGKVVATFISFFVDVHKNKDMDRALTYKELWDNYVAQWNALSLQYEYGAWHTSMYWVRAEAQDELVRSTVITLIFVVDMAFLSMLLFTLDLLLSILVVLATAQVVCCLTFFIVVIMDWKIGPTEVIALIVFIGYAVTYSLHIAHKYSSDEASIVEPLRLELKEGQAVRFQRTRFALRSIGGAAIGSAVTTIGCSVFLLFCTLVIFQKLGAVVLVVTTLSIFTAMAPLPSCLFIFGPLAPGRCWCRACCLGCFRFRDCHCCCGARRRGDGTGAAPKKAHGVPAAPISPKAAHVTSRAGDHLRMQAAAVGTAAVPSQGTVAALITQAPSSYSSRFQGTPVVQTHIHGVLRL